MGIKDINTKKKPVVLIDKSLEFFNDNVLFPKHWKEQMKCLKGGLPKTGKI